MLMLLVAAMWAAAIDETPVRAEPSREAMAAAIEPVLAQPPASGLLVFSVLAGSQAERAGVKMGDILTYYAAQPMATTLDLSRAAAAAIRDKQQRIPVLFRRGKEDIEREFDPAPLGLRLIAVREGVGRTLWRPATPYQPDPKGLRDWLSTPHRFEILTRGNDPVGWAHSYLTRVGELFLLRIQSQVVGVNLNEKRDVTLLFVLNPYLSLRGCWLRSKEVPVLDLRFDSGKLIGKRAGVAVEAELPADAVSSYLAGYVAAMMPLQAKACLRCSYLDAASQSAAPFADLVCLGEERLANRAGEQVTAYRFEQAVFGETAAQYWIDSSRRVIQSLYPNGIRSTLTTREEVAKRFPQSEREFDAIEAIPEVDRALAPRAQ